MKRRFLPVNFLKKPTNKFYKVVSIFLFTGIPFMMNAQNCNNIQYTSDNGQINITNLTAPIEIVDVYDASWNRIFRCEGSDCGNQQTIPNLSEGLYHTNIQFYDANWQLLCVKSEDVTVSGGGTGGLPDLSLSNIQGIPSVTETGSVVNFNFDLNNFGQAIASGAYKINIYLTKTRGVGQFDPIIGEVNTGNTPVGTIPDITAAVTIPFNQNQGDYYFIVRVDDEFDIQESNENNNFLVSPQTIAINQGTGGQTIQCGEIRIEYGAGTIAMKGQANNNYFFKIHDLNAGWAEVFSCGYNCGSSQTATGLADGNYLVRVYNSSWSIICEQSINLIGGGSGCSNTGDTDGDGICNNVDNCPDAFNPDQADIDGNGIGDVCDVGQGVCSFSAEYTYPSEFFNPSISIDESAAGFQIEVRDFDDGSERVTMDINGNILNTTFSPPSSGECSSGDVCYNLDRSHEEKRIEVTKIANDGTIFWSKSYNINHTADLLGIPFTSVSDLGNEIIVMVDFFANDGWFTTIFKLNTNGNEIWQNQLPKHPDQPRMRLFDKATTGGYYLINNQGNSAGDDIIKIDNSGNQLWRVRTTGDLVSNDVFILGETPDATGFYYAMYRSNRPIAVRLNPTNGQIIWEKDLATIFSPNRGLIFGFLRGAVITNEGGLVAGYAWRDPSTQTDGYEYGKVDENGNLVWWHDLPNSIIDEFSNPVAVLETSDGGYIFRGSGSPSRKLLFLKVTNQGTLTPACGSTPPGGGTTIQCGEITINYTSNSIAMNGQSGKNYNYKIHDLNNGWAEIFSCTYQCGSNQMANNLPNGRYLVKIFNESWNLICEQEINLGAGSRGALSYLETFTVFPNPVQDALSIDLKEFAGESATITINNMYGQMMHQQRVKQVPSEAIKIHLDNYINGFYLINIKLKNRLLKSEKFLVKRLY